RRFTACQSPVSARFTFLFFDYYYRPSRDIHSSPTRRSSDLVDKLRRVMPLACNRRSCAHDLAWRHSRGRVARQAKSCAQLRLLRSEEHTSELQSLRQLVCRLLLEKQQAALTDHRD